MTLKDINQESNAESFNKYTGEMGLNEKCLSLIYDTVSDAVFLLAVEPDDCFRFMSVNRAFLDVTGLSREQVVGKRIEDVLPEKAHALVINEYKDAISENKTAFWEQVFPSPTGELVGAVTVTPVWNAGGVCTHLVGSVHDLTERKQVEEKLRKNTELLQSIMDSATEELIVATDPKGIILSWNDGARRLLGYESKEVVGKESIRIFHTEEYVKSGRMDSNIKNMIATGEPLEEEIIYVAKDGRSFPVYQIVTPRFGAEGEFLGTLGLTRDITERKQAEEALQESEERFRTIFDSINDAVFIHDVETGAILDVNSTMCEMYGYSREEVDQLDIQALSSGEVPYTQQDALEWMKKAVAGKPQVFEWMAKHKSGHLFFVEVSMKKAVVGLQERLLVVVRDITERKQAEEKENENIRKISLLSESAMRFVEFSPDEDIYSFIGEQLREIVGEKSCIVVNSINKEQNILTTRSVIIAGNFLSKITKLMGQHPSGMTYDSSDEALDYLSNGNLHFYEEGLYGIILKTVPEPICRSIEKLQNIEKIYTIGFTKENQLFGTIVIFLQDDAKLLKNRDIIEAFINQASMALDRKRAEEKLRKLNEELEQRVKDRTAELEEKNEELEHMNKVFVGRELRMAELKKQIAELEKDVELDKKAGDKTT